jgi:hypothetical protein
MSYFIHYGDAMLALFKKHKRLLSGRFRLFISGSDSHYF